MGLPPQAARIAGSWPNTQEPQRRPARLTPSPQSRSTRRPPLARVIHPFARPARHA